MEFLLVFYQKSSQREFSGSQNKWKTSKKNLTFISVFIRSEWTLSFQLNKIVWELTEQTEQPQKPTY